MERREWREGGMAGHPSHDDWFSCPVAQPTSTRVVDVAGKGRHVGAHALVMGWLLVDGWWVKTLAIKIEAHNADDLTTMQRGMSADARRRAGKAVEGEPQPGRADSGGEKRPGDRDKSQVLTSVTLALIIVVGVTVVSLLGV